ncbi:HyaD/HybD family hydrogenase maturation endopeptidase [Azotobacter chroococcum]|uniref:Hydrogenase expression/formation protein HupM n=2 Tax=Azotobacter chroococcum TaxID=353 RepID=HUPM_AZOCH|nr:HyaD/HybD family hydrogenase maturation endopeptidase [Azotobacter chroococcum]Q43954.1 RecName: Full=Hydrogenase expression/formation protein HupM [Azotobacter chroococcum (strain mcd 1)]AAA64448.1 hydrogenase-related protein [Azotobacter chroococcum]AJE23304.1 Hydrogenase expression/formation protein HoxM [Azotobacter chroococcum NCIMB 8003]ASL28355.1 hydrogenase expression protein [Azotobacter chroococcum]TBW10064.1 HyaD/HybD family hydrogenase maturation endopeptidase [Azotobacter chroo
MTGSSPNILILGIGNLLWADEGFGVRCVELLNERYRFPDGVRLMDGGTQGIYLVQHVQQADCLIVFDAVDYGLAPGTLKVVRDDEVPRFMGAKRMSLHQTGFQDVLALAAFTGAYPRELLLVGVQPAELEDFGGSLREPVRAQLEPALAIALAFLAERGVLATPREGDAEQLAPAQLALGRYEAERPAEELAYRHGDIRFIAQPGREDD